MAENQVIVYGYSIFHYMKRYDADWQKLVEFLQQLYVKYTLQKNRFFYPKRQVNLFPPENVCEVMTYLDEKSLAAAALVCKQWRDLASREQLWEALLFAKFGIQANTLHSPVLSKRKKLSDEPKRLPAKAIYKKMYLSYHGVVHHDQSMPLHRMYVPATMLPGSILVR
jgi:hypothetical protein